MQISAIIQRLYNIQPTLSQKYHNGVKLNNFQCCHNIASTLSEHWENVVGWSKYNIAQGATLMVALLPGQVEYPYGQVDFDSYLPSGQAHFLA